MMKQAFAALTVAVIGASSAASYAAPPTATPSPGYDARLQEQRRAASTTTFFEPVTPVARQMAPRHRRKKPAH